MLLRHGERYESNAWLMKSTCGILGCLSVFFLVSNSISSHNLNALSVVQCFMCFAWCLQAMTSTVLEKVLRMTCKVSEIEKHRS